VDDGFRLGVQLPEVERLVSWAEYAAMARAAEAVGFDSVWLGDHLLYRDDGREERGPWDAWPVLAALATVTERVLLGPLVACTAFSPAGLLARRAAALQEISNGRFIFGLGAGWNETEFRAFGVPFDRRASRFDEAFGIIRRLLAGERVTFEGEFEQVHDAVVLPRPPARVPLMVGSIGERVLRATLPYVDGWNAWSDWYGNTAEGFVIANERVSAIAREVGRPPEEIFRSATMMVSIGGGVADRPHFSEADLVSGSATAIAARLGELREAGVDEAILVVTPITEASILTLGEVVALVKG
jgi:alkanesulfonate monooxygenase SsuD/methylene tetrahydromethanopterin reductase-like flavin-dependent oxidoreductase (luciferase family)